jgi:hypothetical protein
MIDTPPDQHDLTTATAALTATTHSINQHTAVDSSEILDALVLLRWTQTRLAAIEPVLITAARTAGISWQTLAPALGVASRQAAERRYLRLTSAPTDQPGATRDDRVQAERDRRAAHRAITQWANRNTADLRQLAGQVTALTDLDPTATDALDRLHEALGDPDASSLPALLAATHHHLPDHPDLAARIDTITAHTDRIRRQTRRRNDTDPPA